MFKKFFLLSICTAGLFLGLADRADSFIFKKTISSQEEAWKAKYDYKGEGFNIASVGMNNQKSAEQEEEIRYLIKQQEFFIKNCNLDALKSLYHKDYVSHDGYKKEECFKILAENWKLYTSHSYKAMINDVTIRDDYAVVDLTDISTSVSKSEADDVVGVGNLQASTRTFLYLKRIANRWYIVSDCIVQENSILLFGEAKNAMIKMYTPDQIAAGESYTIKLTVVPPSTKTIVLASLFSSPVKYPPPRDEEAIRQIPGDGVLERCVIANTDNVNEVAVASLALTRLVNNKMGGSNFKVVGIAYLSNRVNVIPKNKFINIEEDKKTVKNEK